MIRNLITIILCLAVIAAKGQPTDSIAPCRSLGIFTGSSVGQGAIVGLPLFAGSLIVRGQDDHFMKHLDGSMPKYDTKEYYLQYAPAVTILSMKLAGVKGRSSWAEMLTADAASAALTCGAVEALKRITDEKRPDGSNHHSYPSGHTAIAFMTATMLHHEYGARYPWLSVLGYGTATATGFMRVAQNRHAISDVMAGASIGIIGTELGYMVSDLIFHRPIFNDNDCGRQSDYRREKPTFVGYGCTFGIPTGEFDIADGLRIKPSSSIRMGIEGAWFITPNIGVGGEAALTDMRFYTNGETAQRDRIKYTSALAGAYLSLPISRHFDVGAKALMGYCHINSIDATVKTDNDIYQISSTDGLEYGIGVSLSMRVRNQLMYRLNCDYNIMPTLAGCTGSIKSLSIGVQIAWTI